MDRNFPEELLFQILIRLPVLSLLRFRCVSKFWYALISSFDFIDVHLHHNHNNNQICDNNNMLFTKSNWMMEAYSLHDDTEQFKEIEKYQSPHPDYSIFGCVKGLICLANVDMLSCSNTLMLWNPIIQKFFFLPEFVEQPIPINNGSSQMSVESRLWDCNFGFGYDVLSKDFKVARIIVFNMKVKLPDGQALTNKTHLAFFTVFSLVTKSWKPLKSCTPMHLISRDCTVGRFLYRLALLPDSDPKIVSFDLSTEVFTEIDFPKGDIYVPVTKTELSIFHGSLGLLHKLDGMRYDLWALLEDGEARSWRKRFKIHLEGPWQRIVGFTMKGIMVVVDDDGYSPAEEDGHFCGEQAWQVDSFKESLALLNDGVDVSSVNLLRTYICK